VLAMSSSVDMVFVADAACSLLWGKDIIWSMLGHIWLSYQVEKLLTEPVSQSCLSRKGYKYTLKKNKQKTPSYKVIRFRGNWDYITNPFHLQKAPVSYFYIISRTISTVFIYTSLLTVNTNFVMCTKSESPRGT
jgi:hypothetical protein